MRLRWWHLLLVLGAALLLGGIATAPEPPWTLAGKLATSSVVLVVCGIIGGLAERGWE